ncbi:ABC transporter permease [Schleiferilactobacillus perolens]|uniref:ABC transporter EcsB n=1 Tax=Schleiferilactobacillus perolens DSM 12744 TaxID=1423792 RepID=A0A0R1N1Y6_9LACO|nr:ABC transporter permease [Schleiferilactobacillus perolens]KRL14326.1 ABC transporter EcsB [Schleiferilactobacillus perolens DSM 12744]
MKELWQSRQRHHLTQQIKYLRLVFNDHFMIALIFLFGALGVSYANALKTVTAPLWWGAPLLIIGFWALLQMGKLASLFFAADAVFLQPQEANMQAYVRGAWRYSHVLPLIILTFLGLLAAPFAIQGAGLTIIQWASFLVALLLLKSADLSVQSMALFVGQSENNTRWYWFSQLINIASLALTIYLPNYVAIGGAVLALIWEIQANRRAQQIAQKGRIDWLPAIAQEERRQFRIYRFYNLFTDVPGMVASAKRRKYLDIFLPRQSLSPQHTFTYLYTRGFLRGTEYLGLFLRLTVIGAVILYFVNTWWLAALVAALFIYLIGFQLLPFAGQYQNNVMTFLYPVTKRTQRQAFLHLLTILLGLTWLVFLIPTCWRLGFSTLTFAATGISLLILIAFIVVYAPRRIDKIQ